MRTTISIALLSLIAACHPTEKSKTHEQWNESNNPVLMMAFNNEFETRFAELPLKGRPEKMPWSDHYWPTYHGGLTYRWNWTKTKQLASLEAASSDQQFSGQLDDTPALQKMRSEVLGYTPYTKEQLAAMPDEARARLIATLSVAEKYDIYRGAYDYPTVKSERKRTNIGATLRDNPNFKPGHKIPKWFGICHAWAPATILFNEPGPVTLKNKDGFTVPMAASDVKALLTHSLDKDSSQARVDSFLAERCNNDISQATVDEIFALISSLQLGNKELLSTQINKLLENDKVDAQSMLVIASFMFNFAPDQEYAAREFQKVFETLRSWVKGGARTAMAVSYIDAQKNFADAGKAEATNLENLKKGLIKAIEKPACNDTNPGAFHLVLGNIMGIQKRSFGVDITRDAEVWNQAVASYESFSVGEFTGDAVSEDAAPGTVKEVQIRTIFRYTTEMMPAWEAFGDDVNLQSYHVLSGDNYRGAQGRIYKALEYKIELDREGHIIGGSWLSSTRPDFLWGTGAPIFSKDFSDIEDIYYQSL